MRFDTALNVAWLLLSLLALCSIARATLRRRGGASWLHVVGVALITAALFPYISATDDRVQFEQFHAQHDRHHPRQTPKSELVRLYEVMDAPLVCQTCEVAIVLCVVWLVYALVIRRVDRVIPLTTGRSPPALSTI